MDIHSKPLKSIHIENSFITRAFQLIHSKQSKSIQIHSKNMFIQSKQSKSIHIDNRQGFSTDPFKST